MPGEGSACQKQFIEPVATELQGLVAEPKGNEIEL